ncbi:hypothetical protein BDZ97DRAFT_1829769 [Flammula alnicola]|nr:hypothetical protein BDZ97DRAFT_1829769 [Flammula alnicola]
MLFLTLCLPLALISLVAGNPVASAEPLCKGNQVVTSTEFIGENKNVKLEHISCDSLNTPAAIEKGALLNARQTAPPFNVCGAPCQTDCFTPSGGGPDPNDCHVIADALRFDSQNVNTTFIIGTGASDIVSLSFSTCESFFLNQAATSLVYCRTDFVRGSLIHILT